MNPDLHEWLNLLVRMAHFIAGIMWIGTSFYFVWLDRSFQPPAAPAPGLEGESYLVHGGFFYRVEKRRFGAGEMPKVLHWFIWEATLTWITGFLLLWVVYYTTDGAYLIDPAVRLLTPNQATLIGLGVLVGGWVLYDGLFRSPLGHTRTGAVLALGLLAGLVYFLTHTFSGRGAFIELGAVFGTIMVLNVWVHILPNQRTIIRAARAGREPDYVLGRKAKRRSLHNSYLTIPVLFTMVSNHFSSLYDHPQNGLILLLVVVAGVSVRHLMISGRLWALAPALAAVAGMMAMTSRPPAIRVDASGPKVTWTQANLILQYRCVVCHGTHPSDAIFTSAPLGIRLDDPVMAKALAPRILQRVVVQQTMPFGNRTGMTAREREVIGRWIAQGAEIPPAVRP